MKKLLLLVAAALAFSVDAMPSRDEQKKAAPVVAELMNPLVTDFRAKKKTAAEVGEMAMTYAKEANTEAAKFLLLKGAIWYFAQAKEDAKAVAEKRIASTPFADSFNVSAPRGSGTLAASGGLYCVVDLSAGPNASKYPVSYLPAEPKGGWTDEYKNTKLVLRRIEQGKFMMGGKYEVTLTKPFYMGVFEVTQNPYELVTGSNPSELKGDMRPVEKLSWNMIRGDSATYNWPSSMNVDPSTFVGKLQARTGLAFDLPTEAQWEYACRAGTRSMYNNGGNSVTDLKKLGRCVLNQAIRGWKEPDAHFAKHEPDGKGGYSSGHTVVGSYQPNAWGLYDMHGNVGEWCLNWHGNLSSG